MPRPALPAPAVTAPAVRPKKFLPGILSTLNTWLNAFPFIGMHLVALLVFVVEPTWEAVTIGVALFWLRTWGLTAGFHRYFAHRGYKTSRWFQFVIAWIGTMALQKGPLWWAGEHRKHHRYSDQELDPHSPITGSIFWSHVGWVLNRDRRYTDEDQMKDWMKYPELRWIDEYFWIPGIVMGVVVYFLAGWTGVVWAVASTVCLYHTTFCVNSVCHLLGYRTYDTDDHSRNNFVVAFLTMGEGWHNNHHHYPSAARQGFRWYEIDASYIVLRCLAVVGLVWDLREPTPRALKHRVLGATLTPVEVGVQEQSTAPAAAS